MRHYLLSREGGTAAEYALILAIIGAAIAGAALLFGGAVASSMNNASATIAGATSPGHGKTPPTGPGNCNGNCNSNSGKDQKG